MDQTTNNDATSEQALWETPYTSQASSAQAGKQKVSKREFCKYYAKPSTRKEITGSCVIAYVCAGLTLLTAFISGLGVLIDVLLILGLALGIHIGKSLVCAILLTVYAGINTTYALISSGRLGGWLILAAGIIAIVYVARLNKEYKAYLNE